MTQQLGGEDWGGAALLRDEPVEGAGLQFPDRCLCGGEEWGGFEVRVHPGSAAAAVHDPGFAVGVWGEGDGQLGEYAVRFEDEVMEGCAGLSVEDGHAVSIVGRERYVSGTPSPS